MANINNEEFVSLINKHFKPSQINRIVEVGALDGEDAAFYKKAFPHAHVTAIEGLKENFDEHSPEGVEWLNLIIASYDGEVVYNVKKINGIHGIYDRGPQYGEEKRTVKCHRLDSIIKEPIDVMKIDVEGATYDIFEGMGDLLKTLKIMHIETETIAYFSGQKVLHDGVYRFLHKSGFTCLKDASARINSGKQYDSVWINNEHLDS